MTEILQFIHENYEMLYLVGIKYLRDIAKRLDSLEHRMMRVEDIHIKTKKTA